MRRRGGNRGRGGWPRRRHSTGDGGGHRRRQGLAKVVAIAPTEVRRCGDERRCLTRAPRGGLGDRGRGLPGVFRQVDRLYRGQQSRRVVVSLANGADSMLLEGTLDGTTWFALAHAFTGATTPFVTALSGPYYQIRVTKTGTNGAATVSAII